jgi:hypothetical protein
MPPIEVDGLTAKPGARRRALSCLRAFANS